MVLVSQLFHANKVLMVHFVYISQTWWQLKLETLTCPFFGFCVSCQEGLCNSQNLYIVARWFTKSQQRYFHCAAYKSALVISVPDHQFIHTHVKDGEMTLCDSSPRWVVVTQQFGDSHSSWVSYHTHFTSEWKQATPAEQMSIASV